MTTMEQPSLNFDEIDEDYRQRVSLVGVDWRSDGDYALFIDALMTSRRGPSDLISQNAVRVLLLEDTVDGPRCSIDHHSYSSFWSRACSEQLIEKAKHADGTPHRDICKTSPTGNNGKPQRVYRWIGTGI